MHRLQTRLSIVRHGQTDWNLATRIQGRTDIPLNSTGRAQAAETGLRLLKRSREGAAPSLDGGQTPSAAGWEKIVSSPLDRAAETARIIAGELGLPRPEIIDDLTERHHGHIEGLTFAERQRQFPNGIPVPGLESRQQVLDRVLPALGRVADEFPGDAVLVVCHGGVIGTLIRYLTAGVRPHPDEIIANGSVHDFLWTDGHLELEHFDATIRGFAENTHYSG
ncbi:phosphoglycerate mutase family protein [Cryobacterium breve]|jgi:uncharacterized phosphatase|uniref:Phosphoglycerate mutase family protein n=1 Tax=Cryobacterium breve TaxID=1259258 RepID=A0ABY7NFP3_9MICO|nr:phosphoglycerate mutase family protein [Cryobacterium breve]